MIEYKNNGRHKGKDLYEIRLTNIHGNYVDLINYGAIVKSIMVPDRSGKKGNVILGYPEVADYITDDAYIGATVGPFANRIANASFQIDGKVHSLEKNDGTNNNHSGSAGFNKKIFDFAVRENEAVFILNGKSEDGFPGALATTVTYSWTDYNELIINYKIATNKPTPVNLTNHAYFNLSCCEESIHGHHLAIRASQMLESTAAYIPTGKIIYAAEQEFKGQKIQDVMKGSGINNYYIFDDGNDNLPLCILWEGISGRKMEVFTTYPGVQLYTGNYLAGKSISLHKRAYKPFHGLCLECQYYPDSPNHSHFPDTILRPGQTYSHSITYKFGLIA